MVRGGKEYHEVRVELGNVDNKYYAKLLDPPYTRFDDVQFIFETQSFRIHKAFDKILHHGGSIAVKCNMIVDRVNGITYLFIYAWELEGKS